MPSKSLVDPVNGTLIMQRTALYLVDLDFAGLPLKSSEREEEEFERLTKEELKEILCDC